MNERDREAADDWMRDHLPDPDDCSLEDTAEIGSTENYVFLRYRDSATVVYKVAVKDGQVTSVLQEVYHGESRQEEPDELARVRQADVAAAARSSEAFVDSVERGMTAPSQRTVRAWLRLCDALERLDSVLELVEAPRQQRGSRPTTRRLGRRGGRRVNPWDN